MKKLSTIIALALVITIGGVYAAWNYSQGVAGGTSIERKLNMASIVATTSKGTITADTTGLTLLVDDSETDGKTHCAVLNITGGIGLTFTAAEGADADVANHGIAMKAVVTVSKSTSAEQVTPDGGTPVDILAVDETDDNNVITIAKGLTGTITADDLKGVLIFCGGEDIYLDTVAENQEFAEKMSQYTIVITITEA